MKKRIEKSWLSLPLLSMLLLAGNSLLFAQKPAGWYITYGSTEGTKAYLSTNAHTGKYSACAKATSSQKTDITSEGGWTQGWSCDITSILMQGNEYLLSGWVKTNLKEGSNVEFSIHIYDASPEKSSEERFHGFATEKMTGMNNWTYKQTTFKTPDTIANAHIHFIVHKAGEVWLDDVAIIDTSTGKNLLDNPGFEIMEGE